MSSSFWLCLKKNQDTKNDSEKMYRFYKSCKSSQSHHSFLINPPICLKIQTPYLSSFIYKSPALHHHCNDQFPSSSDMWKMKCQIFFCCNSDGQMLCKELIKTVQGVQWRIINCIITVLSDDLFNNSRYRTNEFRECLSKSIRRGIFTTT